MFSFIQNPYIVLYLFIVISIFLLYILYRTSHISLDYGQTAEAALRIGRIPRFLRERAWIGRSVVRTSRLSLEKQHLTEQSVYQNMNMNETVFNYKCQAMAIIIIMNVVFEGFHGEDTCERGLWLHHVFFLERVMVALKRAHSWWWPFSVTATLSRNLKIVMKMRIKICQQLWCLWVFSHESQSVQFEWSFEIRYFGTRVHANLHCDS